MLGGGPSPPPLPAPSTTPLLSVSARLLSWTFCVDLAFVAARFPRVSKDLPRAPLLPLPPGLGSPSCPLSPGWTRLPQPVVGCPASSCSCASPREGPLRAPRGPPTPVLSTPVATCFSRPAVAQGLGEG